ncbi:MAG TPA: 2-dehydropantoate 2-reductase N-terminal domain-containing protein, partial [Tepidisphaeraceae bacterium]|nr:2-dehydropantoate 2-reductase N-terminal domain-containing protein [Tepidisphaeraceae bacterium]
MATFTLGPEQVRAYRDAREMPAVDLVIVALKATANDQFEPLVRPLLAEHTAILTLQNGLGNEEQLAEFFGPHRILGGLAFVCINRLAAGHVRHTDYGFIKLGEFAGTGPTPGDSPRARAIADLFTAAKVPCSVLPDLKLGRWEKLVWNVPFNGLGAALDLATDQLLAT